MIEPRHPSRLALDRYVLGHASAGVRDHVEACAACMDRVEGLKEDAAAFLREKPAPREEPRGAPAFTGRLHALRRFRPLATAAAAASILVAIALSSRPMDSRPMDSARERAKGGSSMTLFLQRGEESEARPWQGERLREGDTLIPRTTTERPFVLLLGLEHQGRASALLADNGRSLPIARGQLQTLQRGVRLDDYRGEELWIALFSQEPLEAGPLLDELERRHRALASGGVLESILDRPLSAASEELHWSIQKEVR